MLLDSPREYALVLEDDAALTHDATKRILQALLDVPRDVALLYLGRCAPHTGAHVRGEVYVDRGSLCAHAYVMNRQLAQITEIVNSDAVMPPDGVTRNVALGPVFPEYALGPLLPSFALQPDAIVQDWDHAPSIIGWG